uniref:RNase H domain-containing protein n=1 Tax=Ascaris lumbricoides TaxID=6252 RepID=A0A0M3HIP3_ASCLU
MTDNFFIKNWNVFLDASLIARTNGARYWEVIRDGKTARSPLAYNQIITEIVSIIGELEIESAPEKITFEFNNIKAIRKMSRSCEHITLFN